jgi:hypothetical protein
MAVKVVHSFDEMLNLLYSSNNNNDSIVIPFDQGGPTFFFPRAKNSLPVGPKGQETLPGTVFFNY